MRAAGGNRLLRTELDTDMFPQTVVHESQGLWLPGHGAENGPLYLTEGKDTLLLRDVCRPKAYSSGGEKESSRARHPEWQ